MPTRALYRQIFLVILATSSYLPTSAWAELGFKAAAPSYSTAWTFALENDVFAGEDDGYTNGLALFYSRGQLSRFTPAYTLLPIQWLPGNRFINTGRNRDRSIAFGVYQAIQTPKNITEKTAQYDDVPYAGLLAFETQLLSVSKTGQERLTLTVGVVGPWANAGRTQESVHAIIGGDQPQGWDHQIDNEIVASLEMGRGKQVMSSNFDHRIETDISVFGNLALGNLHSFASATMVARFGQNLTPSFPTAPVAPKPQTSPFAFSRGSGWAVFASLSSTLIANQILTEGKNSSNNHRAQLDHTQLKLAGGLSWNHQTWSVKVSMSDFIGGDAKDRYGSVGITRRIR